MWSAENALIVNWKFAESRRRNRQVLPRPCLEEDPHGIYIMTGRQAKSNSRKKVRGVSGSKNKDRKDLDDENALPRVCLR
jgi:hypothetical protein